MTLYDIEDTPMISSFPTQNGTEIFITLEAQCRADSVQGIEMLMENYTKTLQQNNLGNDSEIFVRFYLKDIEFQKSPLRWVLTNRGGNAFYSFLGQPPASGSPIALMAYHMKANKNVQKENKSQDQLLAKHGQYTSIWTRNRPQDHGTVTSQTLDIFKNLQEQLESCSATIKNDALRTWIYLRDIDSSYENFIDCRRSFFSSIGMTENTHYITSTGIGGTNEQKSHAVCMDSLAMCGLAEKQIEFMQAPENMCPAHRYKASFERGTKVVFGDRTQFYISGTASINRNGDVLHKGDAGRQAERTLENIESLLACHGSGIKELTHLVIYLRDKNDYPVIQDFIKRKLPNSLPLVVVEGPICRPSWLIEIEGMAISPDGDSRFPSFF